MNSFLAAHGGPRWVMASYKDWVFGPYSPIVPAILKLPSAKTRDGRSVSLSEVEIREGEHDPSWCRTHRSTYAYEIWCTVCVDGAPRRHGKFCVGKFPRMVDDPKDGGYFIVDGSERAFVNRESMRYDTPRFRHSASQKPHMWSVDLTSLDAPFSLSYNDHTGEIKAHIGFPSSAVVVDAHTLIRAMGGEVARVGHADALCVVERARPVEEDESPLYALGRSMLAHNVSVGVSAKRARKHARDAMHAHVLPHMQDAEKAEHVATAMLRLVEFALGLREATDMDAMENKRIDTAGKFVARMVCTHLGEMWRRTCKALAKKPCDNYVERLFETEYVLRNVCDGMKTSVDPDAKCASMLPREASWQEAEAVVRRVNADVGAASFVAGPRMFHGTWYGFYCACETQEGKRTGLSRETAMFFKCSPHGDPGPWRRALLEAVIPVGSCTVYVNQSRCLSNVDFAEAAAFCAEFKRLHSPHASISAENAEIRVDVSEGRAMRPVWTPGAIVDHDGDFDAMVREGRIEWVDAAQCRTIFVSTTEQEEGNYMELHPTSLFGPSAANVPFADHNAGSRNTFGSHVRHQAIGFAHPHAAFTKQGTHDRFDRKESFHMWYPQRALCDTSAARRMRSHEFPNGWNAVVFILAMPFGQEDSLGIARRHVDLGGGVVDSEISLEETTDTDESFGCVCPHPKLDPDGFPRVGETVCFDDVVACKIGADGREILTRWTKKHPATVRAVCRTTDNLVLIRFGWRRTPEIGDKFASRHGQKGVLNFFILDDGTYWTSQGITPDLIMNPAALPSRMTIGHVFEMLCGKANAVAPPPGFSTTGCEGTPTDCTPYSSSFDYAGVQSILRAHGFQPRGHEIVYNGTTGEVMRDCHVFVGPAFIQRLTHNAFTKCFARARGARNPQTNQPLKGRKNDGGLRLGEGEKLALHAHGGASALQTAFIESSDGIRVWTCPQCREVGCTQKCWGCGTDPGVPRTVPRTFFLMRDQLRVARVNMRLR